MAHILISYRRSDSDVFAGRIRDKIADKFGADSVFMDIDNIPFGRDFRTHIREALGTSDVVIVVVGNRWLGGAKKSGAAARTKRAWPSRFAEAPQNLFAVILSEPLRTLEIRQRYTPADRRNRKVLDL